MGAGVACTSCVIGSGFACCIYVCIFLFLVAPVNIVAIILGNMWMYECTALPVDLGVWLLVQGCVNLGVGFIVAVTAFCVCLCPCIVMLLIVSQMFNIAWIVVGGISLYSETGLNSCYYGNTEPIWIAACVFWCMAILSTGFYMGQTCMYSANSGCSACSSATSSAA